MDVEQAYHLGEDSSNDEREANDHIPADVLASGFVDHTPYGGPTPFSAPPLHNVHSAPAFPLAEAAVPSVGLQEPFVPPLPPTATHATGHISPGHVVGRPIHESPRGNHIEIIPGDIQDQSAYRPGLESQQSSVHIDPVARPPGSEPGVDVRRESARRAYAHLKEDCEIEVIDYNEQHVKFRQFHNESFLQFLETTDRKPPMKVRWINIAGISWDIISALAVKFQLHPLAIEDVLHSRSVSLSKADYFQRHLFLRVMSHALSSKKASPLDPKYFEDDNEEESDSEDEETEEEEEAAEEVEETTRMSMIRKATRRRRKPSKVSNIEAATEKRDSMMHPLRWMEANMLLSPEGRRRQARIAKLNALKKQGRVKVKVSNAFFFLFKDGTLISFHQGDRSFGDPIYQRLRHLDTVLRKDPEASLLLQSLLDLIVDQAIQVVDKYGDKINESETQVLLKPHMDLVQTLHILSADLTLRKRSMQPLKSLVYGLRRFDVQRTAAACGITSGPVEGYMSAKTKIYLSDVGDHIEAILTSLDQFATMTDNLIDFTFNMTAHSTNQAMKRMTILMIVFLPLTLLTGYFGMNFATMPIVKDHSDIIFWDIALPVLGILLPWALWSDIKKMFRYMAKNHLLNRVEKKQVRKVQSAKRAERLRRRTLEMEREKENGLGLEKNDVKGLGFDEKTMKAS